MRNDKLDEHRPNTNLISSSDLEYTTSYRTQFDPPSPYFHRNYSGFVESDEALQSVNISEGVQSVAVFSEGSRVEGANTEGMDSGAIHALDSSAGGADMGDALSKNSDTTLSKDNHINYLGSEPAQPNSVQFERTTSKGKQPVDIRSKHKRSRANRLTHGQSKNKVAQTNVSFEKKIQEPQPSQTPAMSGTPAEVENPFVSTRVTTRTRLLLIINAILNSDLVPSNFMSHSNSLAPIRVLSIGINHFRTSLRIRLENHQGFFLTTITRIIFNLIFICKDLCPQHFLPLPNSNHLLSSRIIYHMLGGWLGPQQPTQPPKLQIGLHPSQCLRRLQRNQKNPAGIGQSEQQLSLQHRQMQILRWIESRE